MSTKGTDHILIKNILILLDLLEKNQIDIDHLAENDLQNGYFVGL